MLPSTWLTTDALLKSNKWLLNSNIHQHFLLGPSPRKVEIVNPYLKC